MIMDTSKRMIMKKFTYIFSILMLASAAGYFCWLRRCAGTNRGTLVRSCVLATRTSGLRTDNVTIELNWTPSDETDTYVVEFA